MANRLGTNQLSSIAAELARKPGHEKVRSLLFELLFNGLGAKPSDIDLERPLPEVRGRVDALLGRTVFEIKSDYIKERADAEGQLLRYITQREKETNQRFTGVSTDGAEFHVFMVRDGKLVEIGSYRTKVDHARHLLVWLESVVVLNDEIPPDVESVKRELGRDSIVYYRALSEIEALWGDLSSKPEATLKRDLWNRLLRVVYGADLDNPKLFLQHTYLTIVAKAIATAALFDRPPDSAANLLDGKGFSDLSIVGAVEADFFDWILLSPRGEKLVMDIARQANRFRLHDVNVDILKGLYESLIDPETRHDLGEYYTPDWLAERMCKAAIVDPLSERVIDPACGSGTFLFHAVRQLLAAADTKKMSPAEAIGRAIEKVAGIDVHPVAIIFARVTYLLALMPVFQKGRPERIALPVYLGDALQWNARELMGARDLEIVVPPKDEVTKITSGLTDDDDEGRAILRFPSGLAEDPLHFDTTLAEMLNLAERNQPAAALIGWLHRQGIKGGPDTDMMRQTYDDLRSLQREGRNHIWGYVARNLSRLIWLATEAQKADVVIGNPPWLAYRAMNSATKARFKDEAVKTGLWLGGKSATAQTFRPTSSHAL